VQVWPTVLVEVGPSNGVIHAEGVVKDLASVSFGADKDMLQIAGF